ncbi:MAG: hypothetical protein WBM02_01475 [bacterium]
MKLSQPAIDLLAGTITGSDLIKEANAMFSYEGLKLLEIDRGLKIKAFSCSVQNVDTDNHHFLKDRFLLFTSHKNDNNKFADELKMAFKVCRIFSLVTNEEIELSTEWPNDRLKEDPNDPK